MTAVTSAEYRTLERESSNDLIRHDARRGEGKYAEAAWYARRAGHARRRMGVRMRDEGQFGHAAEDWLSAAACFYLATDPQLLRAGLEQVRELERAGHVPPERRDLHAAMHEREGQLQSLEQRLATFRERYARLFGSAPAASRDALDFLRTSVRELPGFARLHFAIYRQARDLGDTALAAEHLRWAAEFAPDEPEYVGRYGYHFIAAGQPDRAAELARHFLAAHPHEPSIRVTLAQALASQAGGQTPDREAAIGILREVLTDPNAEVNVRLAAVTLSGAIRRDRGEEVEAGHLLALFDQLATTGAGAADRARLAALRAVFTEPAGNGNGSYSEGRDLFLAEPIRSELFQHEDESISAK